MHHKDRLLKDLNDSVKENRRKIIFIFLLFLISAIISYPLFKQGFPVTDDGTWLIIRFSAFYETLATGQFPVRFIYRLNDGMGYPVSNFLYPLYLYLATPVHILGFGLVNSIKILIIVNIFFSALFTFLWLNKKFGDIPSLIGALVLILSPYFLFDIYKRGSVGELLAFSIVPFILWQMERKSLILLSIGFSFLVLAHNTLGFLFLIFILLYAYTNKFDFRFVYKSIILGLGLSAFFWVPALFDLPSTTFLATKVSSFFDYFLKIKDYYLIGVGSVIILSVSSYFILRNKEEKNMFLTFSIILSIFIIIIQLPISKTFWNLFPFRDFIQFPFRLLSILTFLIVFQAAFLTEKLKKYRYYFVFLILLILSVQAFSFLRKIEFQNYEEGFYSTNLATTTVADEYQNKWFKKPARETEKIQIRRGMGKIERSDITPGKITLATNFESDGLVQVNLAYFPNWKARVNGKEMDVDYKENGLINLRVSEGKHLIEFEYQQSTIHKISNIISVLSVIVLSLIVYKNINFLIQRKQ